MIIQFWIISVLQRKKSGQWKYILDEGAQRIKSKLGSIVFWKEVSNSRLVDFKLLNEILN